MLIALLDMKVVSFGQHLFPIDYLTQTMPYQFLLLSWLLKTAGGAFQRIFRK